MADKNGAVKTSGYSDLPSSELRAKRLGKSDKRKLQKKKELTQKYFVPLGAEDVFDKQAKDYTIKLDEKSILRNKDIDLNNLSDFYKGLNYNDIVPLMDSNLPQNEGSMLLMDKLNRLKNSLGSYSTGMQTVDLGDGIKIGSEGKHTTEVGFGKQPLESMPYFEPGEEPTADEKSRNIAGLIRNPIKTGYEDFLLHTHDDNIEPSSIDLNTAAKFPNIKNQYILSNNDLLEYKNAGIPKQLTNAINPDIKTNIVNGLTNKRKKLILNSFNNK